MAETRSKSATRSAAPPKTGNGKSVRKKRAGKRAARTVPSSRARQPAGSLVVLEAERKVPRSAGAGHGSQLERDSYSAKAFEELLNRSFHAAMARWTQGLSPMALQEAYLDWLIHLAFAPGKQVRLAEKAARKWARLALYALHAVRHENGLCPDCITPLPQDKRFRDDAWRQFPFNLLSQAFLLNQQWWHVAMSEVPGVTQQHEKMLQFATRQMLDVWSPSNFPLTNPEVLEKTTQEGGQNLIRGWQHFIEDIQDAAANGGSNRIADAYRPGIEVATCSGSVVYRNALIELIQYAPTTETVKPEPILIIPAWINKYYILDLSPDNSMVRYLTEQGFTVFMVSWKNPGPEDRELGLDDYRRLGVSDAVDTIQRMMPKRKIHATGYCLGGTLLSIAAADYDRKGPSPFKTLSLLASQVDFSEAGELQLFINESQINFLEDMMWEQGFLDARQMSGAFQLLRSNDLIWSRNLHTYLMGQRQPVFDLMAWNADSTRMPYRMHSEYLRKLYLNNDLAEGRFKVDGRTISLGDIRAPIFAVGTTKDHVAPWRSAYKIHLLTDTQVTFALTNGGHNAGIVSPPDHPRRRARVARREADAPFLDPDAWLEDVPERSGSWWVHWTEWLAQRSGRNVRPPGIGGALDRFAPLAKAPGTYVHMK